MISPSAHEALHTAYLLSDMFDRHLRDHPAVRADPQLAAKAEELSLQLGEFYQAVGTSTATAETWPR
jgi:hypothetical protein